MKLLKSYTYLIAFTLLLIGCGSYPTKNNSEIKEQPVVIENEALEYQIIIIDQGFTSFLNSIAQPVGFYSQKYMEARNKAWVITWNQRFQNPNQFNDNIYENRIDYQQNIDYGYEVNYKLFNYFLFAQRKYKMSLGGGFRSDRIN